MAVQDKPRSKDIIWSYIGTLFSLGSSFLILPFLTSYLSSDDLGLWYIFLAVANLAQLFEFGFNPAFARNFVYCLSGAQTLEAEGGGVLSPDASVNWHLYATLHRVARALYAAISVVVFAFVATGGTAYVWHVSGGLEGNNLRAWIVFVIAIFLNLYYLYTLSNLAGLGDVAGENKAKTFSNLGRIVVTVGLLLAGWGLFAAALGYLAQGVLMRVLAIHYINAHEDIKHGVANDTEPISKAEMKTVFKAIAPVATKNGVDQLALYATTQGTSIICSLFFTLAQTGVYSLGLQLANALATLCYAFTKSYYPSYQAAYAKRDEERQKQIVEIGIPLYWAMAIAGYLAIVIVGFPILGIVRQSALPPLGLFTLMCLYTVLVQHHTIFCNYILATNRIPFMWSFIITSFAGLILSTLFVGYFHLGLIWLALGQFIPQLLYNNWKWPLYVTKELHTSYRRLFLEGGRYWISKLLSLGKGAH